MIEKNMTKIFFILIQLFLICSSKTQDVTQHYNMPDPGILLTRYYIYSIIHIIYIKKYKIVLDHLVCVRKKIKID